MGIQQRVSDSKKIGTITGSNLSFVSVAATFTSVTYANNGGRVQFSSAGVHGLTTSPAVGSRVYVSWSGGTGTNGFYDVYSVDTTTTFTISLTHAAGLGTPTVALAGTAVTLTETVTLPGNSLGLTKILHCGICATVTASTNNKTLSIVFGGTALNFLNTTAGTIVSVNIDQKIFNDGSTSSQKSTGVQGYASSANSFLSASVDTTADVSIGIRISLAAANEPCRILSTEFYLT